MKRLALVTAFVLCSTASSEIILEASKKPGKSDAMTCVEIDLLKQSAPLSYWNEKRDQLGSDWCGSFSLAYVLSHKFRQPISALRIAAKYHESIRKSSESGIHLSDFFSGTVANDHLSYGGKPCDLFESVKSNGFCPEAQFDASEFPIRQIKQLYNKDQGSSRYACSSPSEAPEVLSDFAGVKRVSHDLNKLAFQKFIAQVADDACKRKMMFLDDHLTCKYRVARRKSEKSSKIKKVFLSGDTDSRLEKGFMPILTFEQNPLYSDHFGPEVSPHAVPITARRWNESRGRCEYRIRNSTGPADCSGYLPAVSCAPDEVKAGQVWISGKFIDQTGYYITTIE